MTATAHGQAWGAKHNLWYENHPEQEYYKIALNLENIRDKGEIPDWVLEHNELLQVNSIGNKHLQEFIKSKISKSEKYKISPDAVLKTDVVVVRPTSPLVKMLENSPELKDYIKSHYEEIKSGEFKNNGKASMTFKLNNDRSTDEFAISHTIHSTDIYDMKILGDGTVQLTLVDYYDFSPGGSWLNANAHVQQENNQLKPYILLVPVKVKL